MATMGGIGHAGGSQDYEPKQDFFTKYGLQMFIVGSVLGVAGLANCLLPMLEPASVVHVDTPIPPFPLKVHGGSPEQAVDGLITLSELCLKQRYNPHDIKSDYTRDMLIYKRAIQGPAGEEYERVLEMEMEFLVKGSPPNNLNVIPRINFRVYRKDSKSGLRFFIDDDRDSGTAGLRNDLNECLKKIAAQQASEV